ncbi:MAG TPA: hypothetical protein VNT26_01030 [Candidatus Sulfotelmatobacter sp.]|nr:hypothetical protein [Candidatus Sulfotelmatobacter sp.]
MIEPITGEIQLPSDGIRVGPALSREHFLASPLANQSRELVRNEPYISFTLSAVAFAGHSFAWSLYFRGSVLHRVSIECADAEFGASWSDWSEEREMARKRFHDSLLESALGQNWRRRTFSWGKVDSDYDAKSGFSSIGVTYAV